MPAAPKVETAEYVAMLRRMIAAAGRRVAAGDAWDLAELVTLRASLDDAIHTAVVGLREQSGHSWAEIARPLGVTKQAAAQRWGA